MSDAQEPDPEERDLELVPPGGRLAPGLYMVATPIGAARDITLRALDILRDADVLAAEDTRSLRRLLEIHGIPLNGRPLVAYHDHNGAQARPRLLRALAEGRSVAYAPEAGTPMVSDPGFQLSRAAIEAGLPVTAAPGPSALLAALTVGGLPSDRFCFMGFPPAQAGARRRWLAEAAAIPATLVIYESPKRIHRLLEELSETAGQDRDCALCRELTKRFEEVLRGSLAEVAAAIADRTLKGEIVLLVDRADADLAAPGGEDLDDMLRAALAGARMKDAVAAVAAQTGLPRRQVYQQALALARRAEEGE